MPTGSKRRQPRRAPRSGGTRGRQSRPSPARKARARRSSKLPKTLTAGEVSRLLARPNVNCPTGLRNRAILELMHRTGLRVGEVVRLKLRDIHWQEDEIRLTGKGAKDAVIYLDAQTKDWLERWVAERRKYAAGRAWLFTTLRGGRLDERYVREMVARYADRAGIERRVSPHVLRHTFATTLLREGFNIDEVRKLMRHSDIKTTAIYLHLHDRELARKVRERA